MDGAEKPEWILISKDYLSSNERNYPELSAVFSALGSCSILIQHLVWCYIYRLHNDEEVGTTFTQPYNSVNPIPTWQSGAINLYYGSMEILILIGDRY